MTAALRLPQPRIDEVILGTRDPYYIVRARLDENAPELEGGYGGWELVERARRAPLPVWKAPPGRTVGFALILDGYAADAPVVAQVTALDRMARPRGPNTPPPVVWLKSASARIPYAPHGWIITELDFTERIVEPFPTRILRQKFTVKLAEYDDESILVKRKPKPKPKPKAPKKKVAARHASAHAAAVRTGEHLAAVALRELGDAGRWPEIAELNGIRDPSAITAGQVLRLP